MAEPVTVQIRARDVRPYHYALWCSVGGSPPFANDIVHVGWHSDGRVVWMLDSFNFDFHDPDEVIELVVVEPSPTMAAMYGAWELGPKPDVRQ